MNNQPANRFPKAASISLALLFIIIAILAGYGETHATPAADEAVNTTASEELVWVRQDPPIINVNDDPTYWEATEPRFAGSYTDYGVTETEIVMAARWVDHGVEWYDLEMNTVFDRPPIVLNPPLRYKIKATASHSGTLTYGSVGYQFWYSSSYGAVIEPNEVLAYYPFDANWDGTSTKEWMINPPAALHEGDTFEIYASWWNCPPCNVTWTYKAEPANAVPRLGVEVIQPVVKYQGEEVPPGETFFPEPCPATTTHTADSCANKTSLEVTARLEANCLDNLNNKLNTLIELIKPQDVSDYDATATIIWLISIRMAKKCDYSTPETHAVDPYQMDLMLEKGAVQLNNIIHGQTLSVQTALGTAYTASRGTFLTAYNPETKSATFRAYSTPLLLEPKSGSTMVLKPHHEVKLTSSGFGPVTELPHLYLPMLTR